MIGSAESLPRGENNVSELERLGTTRRENGKFACCSAYFHKEGSEQGR